MAPSPPSSEPLSSPPASHPSTPPPITKRKATAVESESDLSDLTDEDEDEKPRSGSKAVDDTATRTTRRRGALVPAPMWDWAYKKAPLSRSLSAQQRRDDGEDDKDEDEEDEEEYDDEDGDNHDVVADEDEEDEVAAPPAPPARAAAFPVVSRRRSEGRTDHVTSSVAASDSEHEAGEDEEEEEEETMDVVVDDDDESDGDEPPAKIPISTRVIEDYDDAIMDEEDEDEVPGAAPMVDSEDSDDEVVVKPQRTLIPAPVPVEDEDEEEEVDEDDNHSATASIDLEWATQVTPLRPHPAADNSPDFRFLPRHLAIARTRLLARQSDPQTNHSSAITNQGWTEELAVSRKLAHDEINALETSGIDALLVVAAEAEVDPITPYDGPPNDADAPEDGEIGVDAEVEVDADPVQEVEEEDDEEEEDEEEEEADDALEADTDLQPPQRAEALDILAGLEVKFAILRERIYMDKMSDIASEESLILNGSHPELLHFLATLSNRKERRVALAMRRRENDENFIRRKRKADEDSVWSSWRVRKEELRDSMVSDKIYKRRKLEREKRTLDCKIGPRRPHVPLDTPLPEYKNIKQMLIEQAQFPPSSIVFDSNKPLPTLHPLSASDVAEDLESIKNGRPPRYYGTVGGWVQHQQQQIGFPPGQGAPVFQPPYHQEMLVGGSEYGVIDGGQYAGVPPMHMQMAQHSQQQVPAQQQTTPHRHQQPSQQHAYRPAPPDLYAPMAPLPQTIQYLPPRMNNSVASSSIPRKRSLSPQLQQGRWDDNAHPSPPQHQSQPRKAKIPRLESKQYAPSANKMKMDSAFDGPPASLPPLDDAWAAMPPTADRRNTINSGFDDMWAQTPPTADRRNTVNTLPLPRGMRGPDSYGVDSGGNSVRERDRDRDRDRQGSSTGGQGVRMMTYLPAPAALTDGPPLLPSGTFWSSTTRTVRERERERERERGLDRREDQILPPIKPASPASFLNFTNGGPGNGASSIGNTPTLPASLPSRPPSRPSRQPSPLHYRSTPSLPVGPPSRAVVAQPEGSLHNRNLSAGSERDQQQHHHHHHHNNRLPPPRTDTSSPLTRPLSSLATSNAPSTLPLPNSSSSKTSNVNVKNSHSPLPVFPLPPLAAGNYAANGNGIGGVMMNNMMSFGGGHSTGAGQTLPPLKSPSLIGNGINSGAGVSGGQNKPSAPPPPSAVSVE